MKFLLFIFIFSLSLSVKASDKLKGFSSPEEAAQAFINPLKQGSKGVSSSIQAVQGLNGENYQGMGNQLTREIKENGKVVKMREVDSDSRLGGMHRKVIYEMEYANGKKRQVQMELVKPASNAGFHIMRMSLE